MSNYIKLIVLGVITVFMAIAANYGRDLAYQVHAILLMVVAGGLFLYTLRNTDEPEPVGVYNPGEYFDSVIRAGVIATAF